MTAPKFCEDNIHILGDERWGIWEELVSQEDTELDGWIYRDGEVWVSRESLEQWRAARTNELTFEVRADVR